MWKSSSRTKDSTVVVLADGLGSGVKASILSTLTAKIISTMMAERTARWRTAWPPLPPRCRSARCAGVAYSTFTIIHIIDNDEAEIIQYDNPHVILLRDGENFDYPETEHRRSAAKRSIKSRDRRCRRTTSSSP